MSQKRSKPYRKIERLEQKEIVEAKNRLEEIWKVMRGKVGGVSPIFLQFYRF